MKQSFKYSLYLLAITVWAGCSKMDDYKRFQTGGEISYPGIMDSVKILAGKNRVMLTGLFTSDPKITKYRLFWNNRQDSLEVAVNRKTDDTARMIITPLKEGAISVEVRTYDEKNNMSIPVFAIGNVYGAQYEQGVGNRVTLHTSVTANGLNLEWAAAPPNSTITKVGFKNISGKSNEIRVAAGDNTTLLPGYQYGSKIIITTAYLPEPAAIDTFYAAKADTVIKENALAGNYTSSGVRTNYTGPVDNQQVAGTSTLSGNKAATEISAAQIEIDYANLAANGWKYVFTYDGSTITVAPNTTMAGGIAAGSFKVKSISYDKTTGIIHVVTIYMNTAGDAREINETLTLQ
ncbi:DUF4998 domain-containing protein [Chitinophaga sp. RAB17]|uniref:DUF4998 domain-containing protein n=1 Tax=Chitinophaga sp. RAB17 TaxID=3233049 RepID=UPI003F923257